jgi:hypothetical protein
MDLSKLTDSEIELLEKLIAKAKAEGEFEGEVVPTLRIEHVVVDSSEKAAEWHSI